MCVCVALLPVPVETTQTRMNEMRTDAVSCFQTRVWQTLPPPTEHCIPSLLFSCFWTLPLSRPWSRAQRQNMTPFSGFVVAVDPASQLTPDVPPVLPVATFFSIRLVQASERVEG